MGCCTSTPPEHRIQANTQPLPPESKQLIDKPNNQIKKTDADAQHNHQIVADDTCTDEETDNQQNTNTNPINHIIATNKESNNDNNNDNMPVNTPQKTIENILQKQTPGWTATNTISINSNDELLIDKQSSNSNNNNNRNDLIVANESETNGSFDKEIGEQLANRQNNIITELQKLDFLLDKIENRMNNLIDTDLIDDSYDSDGNIQPFNQDSDDSEDETNKLMNQTARLHQTETAGELNELMITDDDDSD